MPTVLHRIRRSFPPLGTALRQALQEGYGRRELRTDLLAGISVGIIAVPLSLALAIASGVPPQHGLYTAFIAGALTAAAGGSRYSVTGPTAAFVVILQPIAASQGLGGLLLATLMAGLMLIVLGWGRLGQLIQFIPHPVTTGFTSGIALVIASLQVRDFLGLDFQPHAEHFAGRLGELTAALPSFSPWDSGMGLATLGLLIAWNRYRLPVPSFLVAALFAALASYLLERWVPGADITTVADRFHYVLNGEMHAGIPPMLPSLQLPWNLPGKDGAPLELSFELLRGLVGPAFAIAMLGAIESLLCAVVADGMTGKKHDPDAELVAQGLGNVLAPLFGGIPATGALARTAASIRAGARSPVAAISHALFVLACMLTLAPLLSRLPMSGLAALLLVVAWNMSERRNFLRILRVAPRGDVLLLLTAFVLTVMVDMVMAITVGVVLGALFFMHRMSKVSMVRLVGGDALDAPQGLPADVRYYEIAGPLFFGAAERAMEGLRRHDRKVRALILDLSAVPTIDATGLVALEAVLDDLREAGIYVAICAAQRNVLRVLREAGYFKEPGRRWYFRNAAAAVRRLSEPAGVAGGASPGP